MVPDKYKDIFDRMRSLKIRGDSNIIDVSEPGLLREKTIILFIGINPGKPKPEKISSDAKLLLKDISDDDFHSAYEESQKAWKFYDFITSICKWENASILNIVHFPTKNNIQPSLLAITKCEPFLKEAIELINPTFILAVGNLPFERLKNMNLKYKIIRSQHYSALLRKGEKAYNNQIRVIREELNSLHGFF